MSRDGEKNKDLETEIMYYRSGGGFCDRTTGVLTRETFEDGERAAGSGNAERDFDAWTIEYETP